MKLNLRRQIIELGQKGLRLDGRAFDEFRPVDIEYDISVNAEGSVRISLGETKVNVGIKLAVKEPYPDSPDKGNLMVGLELSPIASPEFEPGPPNVNAIEISRVIDRGVREADAINFEKLCIKKGELVWQVFIDEYAIDNDGNILDAGSIGAIAALSSAVFPKLDGDKVDYENRTKKKLSLKNIPVACTIVKIENFLLVDPNSKEEEVADSKLTVIMSEDGIHGMQKGGLGTLTEDEVNECVKLAKKATDGLRKKLKLK